MVIEFYYKPPRQDEESDVKMFKEIKLAIGKGRVLIAALIIPTHNGCTL